MPTDQQPAAEPPQEMWANLWVDGRWSYYTSQMEAEYNAKLYNAVRTAVKFIEEVKP